MKLNPITEVNGTAVYVSGDDIDTDRIIPARFMKCITFDGLGEYLFHDVRFDERGNTRKHPLNDLNYKNANILISDKNFGCGSSREHAPQSIKKAGYQAIIAGSFAEIFFGNAINLGITCVIVEDNARKKIYDILEKDPFKDFKICLTSLQVFVGDEKFKCKIKDDARESLVNGNYDTLDELLAGLSDIEKKIFKLKYD